MAGSTSPKRRLEMTSYDDVLRLPSVEKRCLMGTTRHVILYYLSARNNWTILAGETRTAYSGFPVISDSERLLSFHVRGAFKSCPSSLLQHCCNSVIVTGEFQIHLIS
ncbi:Hypothetical protein CINCED_3A008272 [Cinara cedri]|uniref:Uncharacterized protein n=1 Tax=Cinara cedri TaxID=506608 RepID=A0A5E4MW91_9HEMI|nr:Hypothetical protein CINCED_3A008272 [Cinara cedri]